MSNRGAQPFFNQAKEFARMKKADFNPPQKKSDIDINKSGDCKPGGGHDYRATRYLRVLSVTPH